LPRCASRTSNVSSIRPELCPAIWPRVRGSWESLLRSAPRVASGCEHPPTARCTAHASAGISSCPRLSRVPCRSSRSHSYGRGSKRTVSSDYKSLAGFLPCRVLTRQDLKAGQGRVWGGGGRPRPPPLKLMVVSDCSASPRCGKGVRMRKSKSKAAGEGARPTPYNYASAASFSMTTFRWVVTSLCNLIGTANSPTVFSGSWI
jgi:hypothetical protein